MVKKTGGGREEIRMQAVCELTKSLGQRNARRNNIIPLKALEEAGRSLTSALVGKSKKRSRTR